MLSRSAKKVAKQKLKHVHFAKSIVQPPPKVLHQPNPTIAFGSFPSFDPSSMPKRSIFGSPSSSWKNSSLNCEGPMNMVPSQAGSNSQISNSKSERQPVKCSRCLGSGHARRHYRSRIRCSRCLILGHVKKFCRSSQKKPIWEWRPKSIFTQAQPTLA